jgi:hypothetical protein
MYLTAEIKSYLPLICSLDIFRKIFNKDRIKICHAGPTLTRKDLGLPESWKTIEDWLNDSRDVPMPGKVSPPVATLKNPDIPELPRYDCRLPAEFWKSFPSNYPDSMRIGGVKIDRLKLLVRRCWSRWTLPEKHIAKKAVARLKGELPVRLKKDMPFLLEKNAKSAIEHGRAMTDVLGTWLKKGFVAGPFDRPHMRVSEETL